MFRHLPSPRVLRTAVVSLVALAATSVTSSGFAAASGGSLAASSDDTRALQGSGEGGASQACAALGGTVALHEDGTFANNETGPSGSFTWTIGQESTDPYFPGGSSLYTGSTPIQDVNFTYPSSINVLGVVVKGGTDYNVYTGSSNLTGNYISPLVGSGNVANISGFWVCAGTSTLATPSVVTTALAGASSATDSVTVSGPAGDPVPTGTVTFTLYSASGVSEGTDTVSLAGGHATSTAFATGGLAAGTYHFVAAYIPDTAGAAYYGSATDGSTTVAGANESFSVGLKRASVNTIPSPSGTSATDSVTVSGPAGDPVPTGTVTFTLYKGSPGDGTPTGYSDTETLSGGSATSTSATGLSAGSYYFLVSYSGDGTYGATTGNAELVTIVAAKAAKPPKKHVKQVKKVTPYKIPTKPPKTGFGGAAHATYNGGLLVGGLSALLAGLAMMAVALRRRRRA